MMFSITGEEGAPVLYESASSNDCVMWAQAYIKGDWGGHSALQLWENNNGGKLLVSTLCKGIYRWFWDDQPATSV